jgi:CO/xanthine dehydrogenase FAD-binding subunit/aerobic-type carbon monoxide dehydrogenase small subunit (CoxS/CutS family)
MKPPPLRYVRPGTVAEALTLIDGASRPLAGGQSLMPLLNLRQRDVHCLVDLAAITQLQRLELCDDELVIGAGVVMTRVENDPVARAHAGALVHALKLVANPQVRARGTIGGNLAHRDPVSEVATALVALEATATVHGPAGTRRTPVEGLKLDDTELLVDVRIAAHATPLRGAVREVAVRYAARALVVAVAVARLDERGTIERAQIAVGGVAPGPRALGGLGALRGLSPEHPETADAIQTAVASLPSIEDPRADEAYRRGTAAELAVRALRDIATGPKLCPGQDLTPPAAALKLRAPGPGMTEHDSEVEIDVTVNGRRRRPRVSPRLLLSDLIRGQLGLHATHVGCEQGVCGACNVLVDGVAMRSCLMLAIQADGRDVETLEGLRDAPLVAEIVDAFVSGHALQCGFCTPGFIVTLAELRRRGATITPEHLVGNICRCTGYTPIMRVIEELS